MKTLIVTGGIGSGKSLSCRYISRKWGWPVYEADSKVKYLYGSHPTLLTAIEKLTGASLRDSEGVFQPAELAARIFADRNLLNEVERLVFPVLTEDFLAWKAGFQGVEYVILESATILEKESLLSLGDEILIIDAPLEMRIERAAARDGSDRDKVKARAQNQVLMNEISSGKVRIDFATVIVNDGTEEEFEMKIDEYINGKLLNYED